MHYFCIDGIISNVSLDHLAAGSLQIDRQTLFSNKQIQFHSTALFD